VRFRKHRRLTARDIAVLTGLGLLGLTIGSALLSADVRLSSLAPGGGTFFPAWTGARAFLLRNEDPYGSANAIAAHELMQDGAQVLVGHPYQLNLPFFLLFFFFPLALIPDPVVARAVWTFLGQTATIGTVFLSFAILEWRPPKLFLMLLSLLVSLSFYSVAALTQGTSTILLVLGYVGILWAIQSERDELAGALAVLCLCMWEVGLPYLMLIGWRVIHEKRWRVLAGFCMALTFLLLLSFLLYPKWPISFLTATVAMLRSAHGTSLPSILMRFSPQSGPLLAQIVTIVVVATLLFEWAVGRDSDGHRFVWTACLVLAATPLVGVRTEVANLVALVPSLVLVSAVAVQRRRLGVWPGILFLMLVFGIPWFLFWRGLAFRDQPTQDLLFLFLPSISLIGMYWIRWWFLRPARTWLDEVRVASR
jgi:hypothetical protein